MERAVGGAAPSLVAAAGGGAAGGVALCQCAPAAPGRRPSARLILRQLLGCGDTELVSTYTLTWVQPEIHGNNFVHQMSLLHLYTYFGDDHEHTRCKEQEQRTNKRLRYKVTRIYVTKLQYKSLQKITNTIRTNNNSAKRGQIREQHYGVTSYV